MRKQTAQSRRIILLDDEFKELEEAERAEKENAQALINSKKRERLQSAKPSCRLKIPLSQYRMAQQKQPEKDLTAENNQEAFSLTSRLKQSTKLLL